MSGETPSSGQICQAVINAQTLTFKPVVAPGHAWRLILIPRYAKVRDEDYLAHLC